MKLKAFWAKPIAGFRINYFCVFFSSLSTILFSRLHSLPGDLIKQARKRGYLFSQPNNLRPLESSVGSTRHLMSTYREQDTGNGEVVTKTGPSLEWTVQWTNINQIIR